MNIGQIIRHPRLGECQVYSSEKVGSFEVMKVISADVHIIKNKPQNTFKIKRCLNCNQWAGHRLW